MPIAIVDDKVPELAERFVVTLTNPTGGATIGRGQAVGTIQDDDSDQPR